MFLLDEDLEKEELGLNESPEGIKLEREKEEEEELFWVESIHQLSSLKSNDSCNSSLLSNGSRSCYYQIMEPQLLKGLLLASHSNILRHLQPQGMDPCKVTSPLQHSNVLHTLANDKSSSSSSCTPKAKEIGTRNTKDGRERGRKSECVEEKGDRNMKAEAGTKEEAGTSRYPPLDAAAALPVGNYEMLARVVVIDVRDEDTMGGCIRGSVNFPSVSFEQYLQNGYLDKYSFHHYSA